MAKKAKKPVDEEIEDQDEDETEEDGDEDEAPKPKKGKATKKAKSKDEDSDEGFVTIGDLAEEAEIGAQSARVKLREAEVDKPEGGRWRWKDGSKALKAARKAIGL